ncbi:MAG: lysylphosphatidylglycerol synthase domain-containing protein [Capsulimonadales bacterium]|nr:lysylphosphatidylglycerol synthase domain-containing protein [Capsulimonadales bacterium]
MSRTGFNWKRWLKPAFAIVAFAFLMAAVARTVRDIRTVPTFAPGWLLLAALLYATHYAVQAVGWHLILRGLGQPVRLSDSVRIWYGTLVARWIPGPLVYSAARLVMAREAGLSVTAVAFGVILELSYILLGAMVTTVVFASGLIPTLMASPTGKSLTVTGLIALAVGGVTALRPATLLGFCRIPLFRKAVRKIAGEDLPDHGLPVMSTPYSLCLLAYYTVFWILSGVMFGVLARSFLPMTPERWAVCIPTFGASWLAGFLAFLTPAGIGIREGVMWLMLGRVLSKSDGLILAVLSRLMMMTVELLSVLVVRATMHRGVQATRSVPVPLAVRSME